MTGEIFAALEQRFNGFEALYTVGRKLFHGFDEDRKNVVFPYSEVTIERGESIGTWTTDIDEWELRFRYHAKDQRPNSALTWLNWMRAAFKDGNLTNSAFHCCGIREAGLDAPVLKDGIWTAAIRFTMTVQWKELSPSVRGN